MKVTTWGEIQVRSLQKMFLIDGSTIDRNDSTNSYIAAMPGAYNEAVELLSTSNRYITRYYDVETTENSNVIEVDLDTIENGDGGVFELKPSEIYFIDQLGNMSRSKIVSSVDNTIYLDGKRRGTYRIYYRAYPIEATAETPDDTNLYIDPDVAALIPLYIASQLYKDDDISIATVYRNEFEVGRELLIKERGNRSNSKFICTTGWW